jgi:hypothetical protein
VSLERLDTEIRITNAKPRATACAWDVVPGIGKLPGQAAQARKEKRAWLRRFAPFGNGVPSHDGIANVMSRLSVQGVPSVLHGSDGSGDGGHGGEVIAVDGKTARGSHDRKRGRQALHRVSTRKSWSSGMA